MTVRLSEMLDDARLDALRTAIDSGRFPGVSLADAIRFVRSDGILPASDLPVQSFIDLEDWLVGRVSLSSLPRDRAR